MQPTCNERRRGIGAVWTAALVNTKAESETYSLSVGERHESKLQARRESAGKRIARNARWRALTSVPTKVDSK